MSILENSSESLLRTWIRFANAQIPARLANTLLDQFGSLEAVLNAKPRELRSLPSLTDKQSARLSDPTYIPTDAQIRFMVDARVVVVARGDPAYPRNLLEIVDPPPALFVRGRLDEKDRFAVAMVGSRSASPYGRSIAAKIAGDLARSGLTVVSGGAIGIDTAVHRAVVEAGGRTLVVLGCGLDIDYPRENRGLFEQIVRDDRGALLTEFPPGATPEAWRFPMRNRVVSGLGMGVVVVEAGERSGALITASIAGEQGRDVMAVPGNVDREGCRGTNGLIKDGAALVENAQDVLHALGILALESQAESTFPRAAPPHLPPDQRRLLEHLSLTPKHIDSIAVDVNLPTVKVSVEMTMLELSGLVRRLPGNTYIRVL